MSKSPGRDHDRRAFARRLFGASVATLLGACAAPSAPTSAPTIAPASTITLLLWHGWSGGGYQALSELTERFNRQSNSGGRVILQSVPLAGFTADLQASARAGSGPHLALIPNTWVGALVANSVLLPIEEYIPQEEQATLLPAALGGASLRDSEGRVRLYGVPLSFDTLALIYNNTNLLAIPTDTATLFTSTRGLSAPDADPPIWGFAVNLSYDTTIGYLYAFEGRVFNEQGSLVLGDAGRAGTERWLSWVRDLSLDQGMFARPDSQIAVDYAIRSGRALATFDWAHSMNTYVGLWNNAAAVSPLPRLAETGLRAVPYVRSDILAVNARAAGREREAAIEFLRFMISESAQQLLLQAHVQPVRQLTSAGDTNDTRIARAFRAAAEQGSPMPNSADRGIIEQELRFMQQQVLGGLANPTDAVSDADRRLRERLERKS